MTQHVRNSGNISHANAKCGRRRGFDRRHVRYVEVNI